MSSLFISYRRADSPGTVKALYERLLPRLPRWTLFYDHKAIFPGEDFADRLKQEVSSAVVVLVVIGPRWVELLKQRRGQQRVDHVLEEVRLALKAENTVIPLLVENASMPKVEDLRDSPDLLRLVRLNARSIRPDPDFDSDFDRLTAYLDTLGPAVGAGTVLGGKYKILREVGQGGMGIVFEAEQLRPRRRVAVKMILEGMNTRDVLARFDGEKEALARMDHPNIAGVIDAGFGPGGNPYFVMEFVEGEPITAYCDRKRLALVDRFNLFRQVCAAVQHAHQKGIIHRDIKPSNVLVVEIDGRPVPKVIDFGLAKALAGKLSDRTLMSEHGKIVGTLLHASPEQAGGLLYEIDTRTDVYSLGVLLHELTVGMLPYTEEEWMKIGDEAMRRRIIEIEPDKPSSKLSNCPTLDVLASSRQLDQTQLRRYVRGDLDWIILKALEKKPDDRYDTPNALSAEVERFVRHEPIMARKPGIVLRFRKWSLRNQREIRILLAAAATLTTVGAAWLFLADAGYTTPGAKQIRSYLDDHDLSFVRPTPSDTELLQATRRQRNKLLNSVVSDYWRNKQFIALKGSDEVADEWSNMQVLAAISSGDSFARDNSGDLASLLFGRFDQGFVEGYGWSHNNEYRLEPVTWGLAAFSSASRYAPSNDKFRRNLSALQEVLDHAQCKVQGQRVGAWGLFPHEVGDGSPDLYVTAIALHGLLDMRSANLRWLGSAEERDNRIHQAVQYLTSQFDGKAWKVWGSLGFGNNTDITMLVESALLRAGAEMDVPLSPDIVKLAPQLLKECVRRPIDFPDSICLFDSTYTDPEGVVRSAFNRSVKLFWYAHAVSLCCAYKQYSTHHRMKREEERANRALGCLLIDKGDDFVDRYRNANGAYYSAEVLYPLIRLEATLARAEQAIEPGRR